MCEFNTLNATDETRNKLIRNFNFQLDYQMPEMKSSTYEEESLYIRKRTFETTCPPPLKRTRLELKWLCGQFWEHKRRTNNLKWNRIVIGSEDIILSAEALFLRGNVDAFVQEVIFKLKGVSLIFNRKAVSSSGFSVPKKFNLLISIYSLGKICGIWGWEFSSVGKEGGS